MFRKRLIPMALIGCMLTSYVPATALAAVIKGETSVSSNSSVEVSSIDIPATGEVVVTSDPTSEPSSKALEQIIKTVKSKISVPKALSQFEYYFNAENSYGSASWNLTWSSKDYSERINVFCDVDGNISYYNYYNSNDGLYSPKYLKTELKDKATDFIKKVLPNLSGKYEYVAAEGLQSYTGQYNFQFQRVENGIPMPDNYISVGVNYETGKVISFSTNWLYNVQVPSSDVKLTEKEAISKIGKNVTMKLSYQNAYTTDKDGNTKIKAFLVYMPDKSYISVDAKTGEVYTTQNEWVEKGYDNKETAAEATSKDEAGSLTPEEITKLEEMKGLISKDDAIKAVTGNKNLLLDKSLKSITARLYKEYDYFSTGKETKYVWNISLIDPKEVNYEKGDTYRAYANATVDAVTGKLISFNASVKDYYNMSKAEWESVKVKYSIKDSQKILETFFNEQIPDLLKNSVFVDNSDSYVIAYKNDQPIYGGYNYRYERVNEGINYSYNGLYGAVDGVSGKIYSFSYNWDNNVTFESPKNVISPEKAFDYYISKDGFNLVYEINNIHTIDNSNKMVTFTGSYNVDSSVRLVYRTDINPNYISPFTGKQLNYDGKEYNKNASNYEYSDIVGNPSARNIRLLADIGVGFEGGKFLPDQGITKDELTDILSKVGVYYNTDKYKLPSTSVSRIEAAKFIIQILGYDNIANIKGLYSINFKDQSKISEEYLGYAALANGLKLITSDSNNEFKPNDNLTRAQVADLIVNMLSVE
ncbi:MAG: hypothetical protein K0S41_8 [Anaerocolumna sp.]|jgi:hypothetical protein|nr:hypothetical protein [Anaerocolumna sp.]